MAIFTIELNSNPMIKDIYKYVFLITIFHILTYTMDIKNYGLQSDILFNSDFIILLLIIAISVIAYYTIALEILEIV